MQEHGEIYPRTPLLTYMIPTRVPGLWGWGADFSRTPSRPGPGRVRVTVTVTARARVHWQIYTPAGPGPGRGSGNFVWELLWGLIGLTNFWWGLVRSHWQAHAATAATGSGRRY